MKKFKQEQVKTFLSLNDEIRRSSYIHQLYSRYHPQKDIHIEKFYTQLLLESLEVIKSRGRKHYWILLGLKIRSLYLKIRLFALHDLIKLG